MDLGKPVKEHDVLPAEEPVPAREQPLEDPVPDRTEEPVEV